MTVDGGKPKTEEKMGQLNADWMGDLDAQYGIKDWIANAPKEEIGEDEVIDKAMGELGKGETYWEQQKYAWFPEIALGIG